MSGQHGNIENKSFFWSQKTFEPKRTFRWKVRFDNLVTHIPESYIVSVQKPNFGFTVESVSNLGTPKYVKGNIEFRPIEIVCIDDEQNTVSNWIHYYYHLAGLKFSKNESIGNSSSNVLTEKTRNIEISALNEYGNVIEQYQLYNAWISDVKYSQLNYTETGLSTFTLTIVYDNYEFLVSQSSGKVLRFDGSQEIPNTTQIESSEPVKYLKHNGKLEQIHGGTRHIGQGQKRNTNNDQQQRNQNRSPNFNNAPSLPY